MRPRGTICNGISINDGDVLSLQDYECTSTVDELPSLWSHPEYDMNMRMKMRMRMIVSGAAIGRSSCQPSF